MVRLPGIHRAQGDTSLLAGTLTRCGSLTGPGVLDVGGGAPAVVAVRAGARTVTAVDLSLRAVLTLA